MLKKRTKNQTVKIGYHTDNNLHQVTDENITLSFEDSSVDTTNHPNWRKSMDGGGYFKLSRYEYTKVPTAIMALRDSSNFLWYDGALTCSLNTPATLSGDGTMWGAEAYNRMKPTKPMNNLFNIVYELKDIPGMLEDLQRSWRQQLGLGGSKYFLSQVFGWMPFISDVLSLIKTQQQIQKRIDWLLRNQGKWIPRDCNLRDLKVRNDSNGWNGNWASFQQSLTTSFYREQPQNTWNTYQTDRIWASAQFRFFLPTPPPGVKLDLVVRRALQGFHSIRMHELYRAIPWTWLVDWCFNTSKVLENIDVGVADRLAARRFYIMREQTLSAYVSSRGNLRSRSGGYTLAVASGTYQRKLATRVQGFPFYPANPNQLTDTQWAILGALGASRY